MENDNNPNITKTSLESKEDEKSEEKRRPKKKKKRAQSLWPIKACILALLLGAFFSLFSEIILSLQSIILCIVLLLFLLFINIVADIIATAFTSADIVPFAAMSARKVKGAKKAVYLIKRAEMVNSLFSDVIGDICGIISGAAGGSLSLSLINMYKDAQNDIALIITIAVSSIIAAITIGFKAAAKGFALRNTNKIVEITGRIAAFFTREK